LHGTIRLKHASKSAETGIRVGEMVENSGAHDLIETCFQFVNPLDRKLVDLKIVQVVFSLEFLSMAHAGRATVDACHLSQGPAQRMFGCLRCSAARDEDGLIFSIRPTRPK
jgi:hypothetical protein